jgi:hypothetical protein
VRCAEASRRRLKTTTWRWGPQNKRKKWNADERTLHAASLAFVGVDERVAWLG